MAPALKPFQLLEINIISAQDLEPVSRKMRTYATAWVNPSRKLSSCVDADGKNSPTWNDKFVFRVNEEFLRQDTSAVMIEIYADHWFRDVLVGTVRVLVGNLFPPPVRSNGQNGCQNMGMRFVALQVRRPSGRPQGILNIGVALLDSSMRSMPLYTQATSALGYRDLMDDTTTLQLLQTTENQKKDLKPILRRSKSERSEFMPVESRNGSVVALAGKSGEKGSSILSISETFDLFKGKKKKGKASSVISGAELIKKPKHSKAKKGKASSVLSDSIVSKHSSSFCKIEKTPDPKPKNEEKKPVIVTKSPSSDESPTNNKLVVEEKIVMKPKVSKNMHSPPKPPPKPPLLLPLPPPTNKPEAKYHQGYINYGIPKGGKYVMGTPVKGHSIYSDSEVGPSPSEVAAAVMAHARATERKYPLSDNQSSVLDGWSVDESVEGLRSKLERWRMELPPLYDRGGYSTSSYKSSAYKSSAQQTRRGRSASEGGGGSGLFSCFGNIYGYECQCVCGKPPEGKSRSTRFHSPSIATTPGRSFL